MESVKRKLTLKEELKWCLENKPNTRNSDRLLWLSLLKHFYGIEIIFPIRDFGQFIDYIMAAPSQDAVKRIRAQFNQEGLYYPLDWSVAKARGIEKTKWEIALGYATQATIIADKQLKMNIRAQYERDK